MAEFGMPAQARVIVTEREQIPLGKETLVSKHDIKSNAPMPLAQNKAVASDQSRVLRIVRHYIVVEHPKYLDKGHRGANVSAGTALECVNR
jgi:hypothetical protein